MSWDSLDPVAIALAEDLRNIGDLTTLYFTPENAISQARIFSKQTACLSGLEPALRAFQLVDSSLKLTPVKKDGDLLTPGETVLKIEGTSRSILTAERTALNFIQQLSGVATLTHTFVQAIQSTKARVLDTRKTTPGLRQLEKAAVVHGGGVNHRFGLYDMVMVKDNHLATENSLESLQNAISRFKQDHPDKKIELETDSIQQIRDFLTLDGVDVILCDNMTPEQLRTAVKINQGRVILEASGGVTLETIRPIAESGVDFISIGALTHSAPAIDFSLEMDFLSV